MLKKNTYLCWGLTAVLSFCAILVFYDTFFQSRILLTFFKKLLTTLKPVLYGIVIAYLLTPVVNWFDRFLKTVVFKKHTPSKGLIRALSILLTWVIVLLLSYGLLNVLIPELSKSIKQLISNGETYYNTIRSWIARLMADNPDMESKVLSLATDYYQELVRWITNTWIPQAQQAVVLVTGGFLSVLGFLMDMLVGIVVSVYLLATKEKSGQSAKRLLFSIAPEQWYRTIVGAISEVNRIFSGFVRGKLLDSLIIGLICLIVTTFMQIPYAPLVSVVVGITNVIPFFGPFLGAIPSAFLILLVSPIHCLYFVIFIIVLQQFDGNILGPKILGDSTGLSSLWVIISILVGGGFAGVPGMFLGVPVCACLHTLVLSLCRKSLARKGVAVENDDVYALSDADMETHE